MSELWYYVDPKGETAGPVDFGGLVEAFRANGTGLDTMVWIDGMAGWAKAAETPTIVERLRQRRSTVPPPRGPGAVPAARIDSSRAEASFELTADTHPWRRFFARRLDTFLGGFLFAFVFGLLYVLAAVLSPASAALLGSFLNEWVIILPIIPFIWVFEALCLSSFGTTPGKALYGISMRRNGELLSFRLAFWRAFTVFVKGEGLWIPLVVLITNSIGYTALTRDGQTTWDRDGDIVVRHRPFSVLRIVVLIVIWPLALVVLVAGYR